jgi:hypothetical protein
MLAKKRAAGLGCENLKAGVADNGNEPLPHGKRPGRNWISTDRRENTASTVPRRTCCDMREETENKRLCGSDPLAYLVTSKFFLNTGYCHIMKNWAPVVLVNGA